MRQNHSFIASLLALSFLSLIGFNVQPVMAGDLILSNNTGTESSTFFIDGEPTLVMNGFDLSPLNVTFPVAIDAVTIGVDQGVAGEASTLVIYADTNGGSPQDAVLLYQQPVTISQTGNVRVSLAEVVVTDAPVIWVGFYLPVGFQFLADNSGSSVLTYWGWSPGTTFDLSNLSSAAVFGPSDGSGPVNIDLGGIARIVPELVTQTTDVNVNSGLGQTQAGVPVGVQIQGGEAPLSLLQNYPYCGELLFYDPQDIDISARERFDMFCRADLGNFSPGTIINVDELPRDVPGYERRSFFYEVFAGGDYQADPRNSEKLAVPVTHCIRPFQEDLDTAVIGIGYGAPRAWEILPTQRYGELACAEVTHQGFISYFVPRTGDEPTLNADLYISGFPTYDYAGEDIEYMDCAFNYNWTFYVRNEGFEPTPDSAVQIIMRSVRTGEITKRTTYLIGPIPPGQTAEFNKFDFIAPDTKLNEAHSITFIVDPNNNVPELNEQNNILQLPDSVVVRQSVKCL